MNSPLELTSIGIYLVVLLGISLIFRQLNKNVSDYFRSGCKGTWWLVGSSILVSGISAYTFTGNAGAVFEAGWSPLAIYIGNAFGFIFLALFLAGWFRQLRGITSADVVRSRFGPVTEQATVYMAIPFGMLHSAFTLYGLSIFSSAVLGYPVHWIIIGLGGTVLIYSTLGGTWGIMATDFIQGIIILSITILMAVLSLGKIGGVGSFLQAAAAEPDFEIFKAADAFEAGKFSAIWIFTIVFLNFISRTNLQSSNLFFSTKDGREARKSALLAGLLMAGGSLIWFIPPMVARLTMADEVMATEFNNPAEASYAVIARELLPNGMLGLMVIAMFAATMSSMDTGLNRNAALIVQNLLPPVFRKLGKPQPADKTRMRIGQIITACFGLLIIVVALHFSTLQGFSMFQFLLDLGVLFVTPVAVPMFLGLYIKRSPSYSALVSWGCGAAPSIAAWVSSSYFDVSWSFQVRGLASVACGTIGFLATMPFYKRSSPEYIRQVDHFFKLLRTPVDFTAEVGKDADQKQTVTLGYGAIIVGCLILPLLMISNPWTGRLGILFVSLFCIVIGSFMLFITRQNAHQLPKGNPEDLPGARPVSDKPGCDNSSLRRNFQPESNKAL